MLAIALDTSTLRSSIGWAVFDDDAPRSEATQFAEISAPGSPGHAETLLPRVQELLDLGGFGPADVDLIVFARGPGTFTGLRIGLSTVKGLALAAQAAVVGISSLEALALCSEKTGLLGTLIDARRKELFGALYAVDIDESGWPTARCVIPDRVGSAQEIATQIGQKAEGVPVRMLGNGAAIYREDLLQVLGEKATLLPDRLATPGAYWMLRLGRERYLESGGDNLATLEPEYLREPDAKLPSGPQKV